jgi:DNA-binding response OmpR family regulator
MIVEESNLHVQVSTLRRALGEDRDVIKTVARRGYLFAAEVSLEPAMAGNSPVISLVTAATPNAQAPPFSSLFVGLPGRQPLALAHSSASARDQIPAVAVIDDDSDVREALRGLLRSVGLRVELFASVQEFLDASHAFVPSCLVLDVRLPGRSGLDFLDEIAKERVPLPVIFISGHADVPMSVRAMKAGAFEFLTKPVRHQELLDAIHRATGTVLLNVADASA